MIYQPRTVGFKAGERNIFLHLLTACNLSCSHCYINPEQHGSVMLSRKKIGDWLKLFSDKKKHSNLIFLGGEPTMHPDLAYGLQVAKDCGFHTTVDTNGYLFYDFLDRVKPEILDYLSFSLDGPDSTVNDPIRGEGVFEVCTANLRRAVGLGFKVSLIYTVSSLNIEHLYRMPELLAELGADKFFIQVIGLRGKSAVSHDSSGCDNLQIDPEQWLRVVPEVAAKTAELGINVVYPKVYLDEGEEFQCAGNVSENFFIFPNGRVYQCPICEDHPIHAYEIKNNQLIKRSGLTEDRLFKLSITEGCVMNKLLQPDTITYRSDGTPMHRISCCLLKQQLDIN